MFELITAFVVSFAITLVIIRTKHLHQQFSDDFKFSGPQNFHQTSIPRIGGISIAISLFVAIVIKTIDAGLDNEGLVLLLCALPAFAIGLTEDFTKNISVRLRLFCIAISALCVIYLLGLQITTLDILVIDFLFTLPLFGVLLTVLAITGLTNAYNIIDGFNGLSSMVGILTLLALSYIAFRLGDTTIIFLALVMAGAIFGFFIWNYPQGLIFLGDGGAYLIGFWIASLSIWLCARHPEVSPWFALLINGYPIMETMFTIYRRKIHQGKSPVLPDGIHFHTLIYRRILLAKHANNAFAANVRTAPYLWILAALCIIPALLWRQSTSILMAACALFMILYVWLYTQIVQFKRPKWFD